MQDRRQQPDNNLVAWEELLDKIPLVPDALADKGLFEDRGRSASVDGGNRQEHQIRERQRVVNKEGGVRHHKSRVVYEGIVEEEIC